MLLGYIQQARLDRANMTKGVIIDLVPVVVAIAMLDQRVADNVSLAVIEKFEIMARLDAERTTERGTNRRQTQFDIVISEQHDETASLVEKAPDGVEHGLVPLDDRFEFSNRPLGVCGEGRPRIWLLVALGQKVDRIAVQDKFARPLLRKFLSEAIDELRNGIGAGAQPEAALTRSARVRIISAEMQIGNDINATHLALF